MTRTRTQSIHDFVLDHVAEEPRHVARRVAEAYGISRQAANRHLDAMVEAGLLEEVGQTRAREYRLRRVSSLSRELRVTPVLNADRVWDDHLAPILADDRPAVRDLCRGAFRELIGAAASRTRATWITFSFQATARHIDLAVSDDGAGLFESLAAQIGAASAQDAAETVARHARMRENSLPTSRLVLLARNFESFRIDSSGLSLEFDGNLDTWQVRPGDVTGKGTTVVLRARRRAAPVSQESEPDFAPVTSR